MGFFDSTSTSSQTGASDNAKILSGKASTLSESGSVALSGKNSKYISPNSVDLSGATLTDRSTSGLQIGQSASVGNIVINDTATTNSLASQFANTVGQLASQTTETLSSLVKNFQASQVAPASPGLADAIVSDTATDKKTSIWVVLGGIAALFAIWYYWRKS